MPLVFGSFSIVLSRKISPKIRGGGKQRQEKIPSKGIHRLRNVTDSNVSLLIVITEPIHFTIILVIRVPQKYLGKVCIVSPSTVIKHCLLDLRAQIIQPLKVQSKSISVEVFPPWPPLNHWSYVFICERLCFQSYQWSIIHHNNENTSFIMFPLF